MKPSYYCSLEGEGNGAQFGTGTGLVFKVLEPGYAADPTD